jgi:sugar fermentation stimulation protein A
MPRTGRETQYDLIGVCHKNQVICVDSRIPNKLVHRALENGDIAELDGYTKVKPEFKYNHVRFDFFLTNHAVPCLLEVKSCTLVRHGRALFPDAVTVRGRKHVEKLAEAAARGYRSCVLFVVQRTDASVFSPDYEVDPRFGAALCKAAEAGVDVYAYHSEFAGTKIILRGKLEVAL